MKKFWLGLVIGAAVTLTLSLGGLPTRRARGEKTFSLEVSDLPEQALIGQTFDVTVKMQNRSLFSYVFGTNGRSGCCFTKRASGRTMRRSWCCCRGCSIPGKRRIILTPVRRRSRGGIW